VAAVSGTRLASARDEERSPEVALSHDLDVAAKAWAALKEDPGEAQSREVYNYSCRTGGLAATSHVEVARRASCYYWDGIERLSPDV
jgi:hypothetical protein